MDFPLVFYHLEDVFLRCLITGVAGFIGSNLENVCLPMGTR